MTNSTRVRLAREDEWEDILAADRACLPYDDPPGATDPNWWVAVRGEEILGYVGAYESTWFPGELYLFRIGVLPEARGQRLSERLIRAVIRYAAGRAIVTDTATAACANALFRCGFRVFEPDLTWGIPSAIYLRRAAQ